MHGSDTVSGSFAETAIGANASRAVTERREYNPLSVAELGLNAARALMEYDIAALPPAPAFGGAGVYTLHYSGDFAPYSGLGTSPIYVGKADHGLHGRLTKHANSINASENLRLEDFGCRWLILEQVWINLTEQILIKRYSPLWNVAIKGFGNHDPGSGRYAQKRSQWDTVHPGRPWARGLADNDQSAADLVTPIRTYLSNQGGNDKKT